VLCAVEHFGMKKLKVIYLDLFVSISIVEFCQCQYIKDNIMACMKFTGKTTLYRLMP